MKQKDYYTLLSVNRHSSKEEIKQNYRMLAKKYHPDANIGSPEAEEVFKDLTVAYDILMDKEKKKKYDRQVARYGYGIPSKTASSKNGKKYGMKNTTAAASEIISTILGIGKDAKNAVTNKATEMINKSKEPKKGENLEASIEISLEEGFFGTEKKLSLKTISGKINNYTVSVPRGIRDGEKIRLAALGKPGKNGGKNGDLIINVKMKTHQALILDGADVKTSIDISYAQAVIGDKMFIKIFGEQVEVIIPPEMREQAKITIPKQGYITSDNMRGNLIITVNIRQPQNITQREKKVYEQLLRVEKQQLKEKQKV